MTHIERRARIIRKARRIVILLLIGVTIAIALIDITEEQEPTNTTNNVSTGHKSPQDIPPKNKEVVVKKEKVTTENEDKSAPEQKAKKTLEFDNRDNEKQVVSSEVDDKNEREEAVAKVENEQDVNEVTVKENTEIAKEETKQQQVQPETAKTAEKSEKTVETYRDVKEYDENPQVVETPKQQQNHYSEKPPVLEDEVNEKRFVEETVEEQPDENAEEAKEVQKAVARTTEKENERVDVAYKPQESSSPAKALVDDKASEYIVQPNDTISHIALYYYGKGKSYYWKYIATYNKISQEKRLKIKQHLYIPTLEFIEKHYVVKKPIEKLHKKTSEYVYYTVEKGDSLDKIAEDNETTYKNILDCNNWLKRNPLIKVGMILRVPKGKKLVGK